jgi:hypothetical protein
MVSSYLIFMKTRNISNSQLLFSMLEVPGVTNDVMSLSFVISSHQPGCDVEESCMNWRRVNEGKGKLKNCNLKDKLQRLRFSCL